MLMLSFVLFGENTVLKNIQETLCDAHVSFEPAVHLRVQATCIQHIQDFHLSHLDT